MDNGYNKVDKVRASRDGHEFHEAWVARMSLQLLMPQDNFIGIAVEGLSPSDQKKSSKETTEIADLTIYHGSAPTFEHSHKIAIKQLKYSIVNSDKDFRCSDAKKTVTKFAKAYLENVKLHGLADVQKKLTFQILTNRPMYTPFLEAIKSIANQKQLTNEIKAQAEQFIKASKLKKDQIVEFAKLFSLEGSSDSMRDIKLDTSKLLVDWSATSDPIARARLGALRQMVRDKAGSIGARNNVIYKVDVLAALEIGDIDELLPCPEKLPDPGIVLPREQLQEALSKILKIEKPMLVHAEGGIGKTVFLKNLADTLSKNNVVIFFDCFGGGSYRTPEDPRHLARRGLIHIINTLACQGLCDPTLPNGTSPEILFSTFRKRLEQCVQTITRTNSNRKLILFLDAIDNAALQAKSRKEDSFPTELLKSFHVNGIPQGVKIIVSCRSHRIPISDIPYENFQLNPFTLSETRTYLNDRKTELSETEIQVAYSRSKGNARILEYLLSSGQGLLEKSETDKKIELNDLIEKRIQSALTESSKQGYDQKEVSSILGGLAVLPQPIPLKDYADAQGFNLGAIESFVADLAPLLENTKYGIMFRDEPTETYMLEHYGSDETVIKKIASNLSDLQDKSVYAAQALPDLLLRLDDSEKLFELAFDERIPAAITSTIGKNHIRYSRLKSAVYLASMKKDSDKLIHLLLELARISATDQRGVDYILNNPNLAIAANDVDATRRLFETRTSWPGKRHARLAIAHTLSGDYENANRHAVQANEWIRHHFSQKQDNYDQKPHPEVMDIAAIPITHVAQGETKRALEHIRHWRNWYSYQVCTNVFEILQQDKYSKNVLDLLNNTDKDLGCIAAALTFLDIEKQTREILIKRLSNTSKDAEKIAREYDYHLNNKYKITGGLTYCSALAISLGKPQAAYNILNLVPHDHLKLYSFKEHYSPEELIPFLLSVIIKSNRQKRKVECRDIIPIELIPFASKIKGVSKPSEFKNKLKEIISPRQDNLASPSKKSPLSYDDQRDAERFIDNSLEPLLELSRAFQEVLNRPGDSDKQFLKLLDTWSKARETIDPYYGKKFSTIFQILGAELSIYSLAIYPNITTQSVDKFLETLHLQPIVTINKTIEIIGILAKRLNLQALAGKEAVKVEKQIQEETDVTTRSSYYADLARAILPASLEETKTFFKKGLEQMDAIGSGDNDFTNELLLFVSSIKGSKELNDESSHILENICELNLPEEEEKFQWSNYGAAMSRVAGLKGLAKLLRWDDRDKVTLDYTLLPYLRALVEQNKIPPEDALILNKLTSPVELWECGTGNFSDALTEHNYPNQKLLLSELIEQYERNHHGFFHEDTYKKIAEHVKKIFGDRSREYIRLVNRYMVIEKFHKQRNSDIKYLENPKKNVGIPNIDSILSSTLPVSTASIQTALDKLQTSEIIHEAKDTYFELLRNKITYAERGNYIQTIASHEGIDLYFKLSELKKCKEAWVGSSSSVVDVLKDAGISLCLSGIEEFISYGQLSTYTLKEISDISGVSIARLALELVKSFTSNKLTIPASVWLGLGSCLTELASQDASLAALQHLLSSSTTKLSENVTDGKWTPSLFPTGKTYYQILAGIIWRSLGSPKAEDRWRAAHTVRYVVKLGRIKILDELVLLFNSKNASSFQAPELTFYHLHARLWLLIALARIAKDEPNVVASYSQLFIKVLGEKKYPHPTMRHYAANALTECTSQGAITLSQVVNNQINQTNVSKYPKVKPTKKTRRGFYEGRPEDAPKPTNEFHLDYDFEKYEVSNLADVFGLSNWEVTDRLSEIAHNIDPKVKGMNEAGGRYGRYSSRGYGMVDKYHTYGEQLGWHCLQIVAGKLLEALPVTEDDYYQEPWSDWLNHYALTIKNGLWLSDGTGNTPLDISTTRLLEKLENSTGITGDRTKIMKLLKIHGGDKIKNQIVIDGCWKSIDGIQVSIDTSLVEPSSSVKLAKRLLRGDPFRAWLPNFEYHPDGSESLNGKKVGYIPWTSHGNSDAKIDDQDPFGSILALNRLSFSKNITNKYKLHSEDPFKRVWKISKVEVATSQAWKSNISENHDTEDGGQRLLCKPEFLKQILTKENKDLLILVNLQRYEEGYTNKPSIFTNSTAVIQINKMLDVKYHAGTINKGKSNKF
ncbi:MAG: ATP-binding protein [Candidatus Shapirobacteria bacterium]